MADVALVDAAHDGGHHPKQAKKPGAYAVVEAIRTAQDGRSASLTAPNQAAQQQLLQDCLDDAGMQASALDYLEAHGTGEHKATHRFLPCRCTRPRFSAPYVSS